MKASMTHQTAAKVAHDIYPELTERQAVVVYLTALAGVNITASSLGISIATTRQHLERAKERLDFSTQNELRLTTLIRITNYQVNLVS